MTAWAAEAMLVQGADQCSLFVQRAIADPAGRRVLASAAWKARVPEMLDRGLPVPIHLVDGHERRPIVEGDCWGCMVVPRWWSVPIVVGVEVSPDTGMVRTVPDVCPDGHVEVTWSARGPGAPDGQRGEQGLHVSGLGVTLSLVAGQVVAVIPIDTAGPMWRGDSMTVKMSRHPHARVMWSELGPNVLTAPLGTPGP